MCSLLLCMRWFGKRTSGLKGKSYVIWSRGAIYVLMQTDLITATLKATKVVKSEGFEA